MNNTKDTPDVREIEDTQITMEGRTFVCSIEKVKSEIGYYYSIVKATDPFGDTVKKDQTKDRLLEKFLQRKKVAS